ncbi:AsnC family protein [Aquibium oceanicum]
MIAALQDDGRLSNVDLAAQVGLSPSRAFAAQSCLKSVA